MSQIATHPLTAAEIVELERSVPLLFTPALVSAIRARLFGELHEPDLDDDLVDLTALHRAVDTVRESEIESLAQQMSRRHGGKLSVGTCASLMSMMEIKSADDRGCLDT